MADYGIKVSRDGYAVTTIPNSTANIKKFALLSSTNLLKIKSTARLSINDGATSTIAHGLAYTPIVWAFMKNSSNDLVPVYDDNSGTYMYVNSNNLYLHNADGGTRDFYYYIFYDQV